MRFINDHSSDRTVPEFFDSSSSPYRTAAFAETIDKHIHPDGSADEFAGSIINHTASLTSIPDSVDSTLLQLQVRDADTTGPGSEAIPGEAAQL